MSHILIADDDPIQLKLRQGVIESLGHEVSVALSVRQTVRTLRERSADLIITDLRFPNAEGANDLLEGLALIRQIREISTDVPLLVLSGWPGDLDGHPEAQLVTRVMMKPVKSAVLLETIQELMGTAGNLVAGSS